MSWVIKHLCSTYFNACNKMQVSALISILMLQFWHKLDIPETLLLSLYRTVLFSSLACYQCFHLLVSKVVQLKSWALEFKSCSVSKSFFIHLTDHFNTILYHSCLLKFSLSSTFLLFLNLQQFDATKRTNGWYSVVTAFDKNTTELIYWIFNNNVFYN